MIKIISDPKEMELISKEWNELAKPFKSPLLRNEWFAAFAQTLDSPNDLRIIVNYSQGKITAIAPLVLRRNSGQEKLEILGTGALDEPAGFIYQNQEALSELIEAILRMKRPLLFKRLGTEFSEARTLRQLQMGKSFWSNELGAPFLELRDTWDDFLAGMTSDNRNQLKRKQKLLEQQGKVSLEISIPDSKSVEYSFEELIGVETAGWKGQERTSLLWDERLRQFYNIYILQAARQGLLRFCFLRVNDKAIAAQLAIQFSNIYWMLKIGYDEQWAKYSPGIILTHETIRYAYQQKLDGYEFLGHDEYWIHRWTRRIRPTVTLRSYPYSVAGIGCFAKDAFKSISERVVKAKKFRIAK